MDRKKLFAFTLAEALIALVTIGIVSALTVPTIMLNKEKQSVPVKLQKFYLNMEQGARLYSNSVYSTAFPISAINNSEEALKLWNKYFKKYFSTVSETKVDDTWIKVIFNDGTSFIGRVQDKDRFFIFFCTKTDCEREYFDGKKSFLFTMYKGKVYTSFDNLGGEIATPDVDYNSRDAVYQACKNAETVQKHWCARLIQMDGWTLADDYPW